MDDLAQSHRLKTDNDDHYDDDDDDDHYDDDDDDDDNYWNLYVCINR